MLQGPDRVWATRESGATKRYGRRRDTDARNPTGISASICIRRRAPRQGPAAPSKHQFEPADADPRERQFDRRDAQNADDERGFGEEEDVGQSSIPLGQALVAINDKRQRQQPRADADGLPERVRLHRPSRMRRDKGGEGEEGEDGEAWFHRKLFSFGAAALQELN